MTAVPTLLMKGLAEGLVLATVEREPARGQAIYDELERVLGEAPNSNQVFPLLTRLHEDGYLRPQGETGTTADPIYRLAEAGTRRLAAYRALPPRLQDRLSVLFDIGAPAHLVPELEGGSGQASVVPAVVVDGAVEGDWVGKLLARLPVGPPVRAPYAKVSLNRDPGSHAWVLRVEHHEPGAYPGAEACPLAFLYEASKRLLFGAAPIKRSQGTITAP